MTNLLKMLVFVLIISSCSDTSNKQTKKALTIEDVLTKYMRAWAEHDKAKIETFYDENVEWYDLPSNYTTNEKKQVGKAITDAFLNNVKNMYWVKSGDTFVSGKTITYEWIYGGVFSGKWGNLNVEDKKFEIRGISTTSINNNGKISSQKDYYDLFGFQKQLGLLK